MFLKNKSDNIFQHVLSKKLLPLNCSNSFKLFKIYVFTFHRSNALETCLHIREIRVQYIAHNLANGVKLSADS